MRIIKILFLSIALYISTTSVDARGLVFIDCEDGCRDNLIDIGNHLSKKVTQEPVSFSIWASQTPALANCLKSNVVNNGSWQNWGNDWQGFREYLSMEVQKHCLEPMFLEHNLSITSSWLEKERFYNAELNKSYGLSPSKISIDSYLKFVWVTFSVVQNPPNKALNQDVCCAHAH